MSEILTSSTALRGARKIIGDSETTGLDKKEDRVIELAGVEVIGNVITGEVYHQYINPGRQKVHEEAFKVHGLSNEFLAPYPTFDKVYKEYLAFIGDATVVFHNAPFDMGMIGAEFDRLKVPLFKNAVEDTLIQARKLFPGSPANLDALCRRFGIDNTHRTKHGALLDSEILAEVYIKMHRLDQLNLKVTDSVVANAVSASQFGADNNINSPVKQTLIVSPRAAEIAAHNEFLAKFIKGAIWKEFSPQNS
jgi:DNA polymerase-3 subunit epsilon